MKRSTAFKLLNIEDRGVMAQTLGITRSAVRKWPEELPRAVADRIIATGWRLEWKAKKERGLFIPPDVADALRVGTERKTASA